MGKCLIIRKGGGGADCTPYINELAISQGLLAYSDLILASTFALDLENGKSFGFDNVNTVQYKALKGTYSESVIINPTSADTILVLNTTVGLNIGDEYTLQDGSLREWIIIQSIDSSTVVTIATPLVNSYTSAYLYDSYQGNPVGVVDYDFRADVLANVNPLIKVWDLKTEFDVDPVTIGWTLALDTGSKTLGGNKLNINTIGSTAVAYVIESGNVVPAKTKRIEVLVDPISTNGTTAAPSQSVIIGDGVKAVYIIFAVNGIFLGNLVTAPKQLYGSDPSNKIVTIEVDNVNGILTYVDGVLEDTSLYSEAFTSGINEINFGDTSTSTAYASNVDWIHLYYQLDLGANPDTPGSIIPMDLITQSYTLTNASGATLEHFAKFGSGAYNLMTLLSDGNYWYENVTTEDNIKIKTTVVGDTSQLLDIQLELGGISDVS